MWNLFESWQNQDNCSGSRAFKIQRYRVWFGIYQKLLHHYQHAENQLNLSFHSWPKRWCPFVTKPIRKLLVQFLALLNLYQHVQNHLNSLIHSSDTRESHGIKGHVHLWPNPPKNYCIIISSSEFVSATKISPIHQFSLEIKQILETHNQKSNNHFWPQPSNTSQSKF